MQAEKARVSVTAHTIAVFIRGIPHLLLRRSEVIGLQGYIKSVGPVTPIYFVEITTRSGRIDCDYDERWLWEEILKKLGDACLFDERLGQ